MATDNPTISNDPGVFQLAVLESLIRQGPVQDDFEEARGVLRSWLFDEASGIDRGSTIGDVVAVLAENPKRHSAAAAVLLRCLAVPDLLPPANSANQLARNIVALSEGALPNICEFVGLGPKKQTFEKFEILRKIHDVVSELLSPIGAEYIGLDSIHAARKTLISALNHSFVRIYCEPFRLAEVRGAIELLSNRLNRVSAVGITLVWPAAGSVDTRLS